jgi:hypothetical protein
LSTAICIKENGKEKIGDKNSRKLTTFKGGHVLRLIKKSSERKEKRL